MIGRTSFHNVAGTRCATDFVELPSVLMEYFATSPAVLPLFARHHSTDTPLPVEYLEQYKSSESHFYGLETHSQLVMAALDQALHTVDLKETGMSTNQIYYDVQKDWSLFPPVENTSWQTQFGHLFGYGACYYSYLFDRAIASKIWTTLFQNNPLDRQAGEQYRQGILRWGGSREPWECIADTFSAPELAKGGDKAMAIVGDWGILSNL